MGFLSYWRGAVVRERVDFVWGSFKILGSDVCVDESAWQKYEARFAEDDVTFLLWKLDDKTLCHDSMFGPTTETVSCSYHMTEKHLNTSSLLNVSDKPCSFYFSALSISELTLSCFSVCADSKNNVCGLSAIFFYKKMSKYRTLGLGSRERLRGFKEFRFRATGIWTDFQAG